jgi:hypothetical protein
VSSPEPHPDGVPAEVPGSAWQLTARRHRRATALFQGSDLVSVVCDSVAPFWTSDAFSGSLRWPKRSLTAGHLRLATKDHPHMNPVPLRVPHCLPEPSDLSTGPTPWVSRPFNDTPRPSPLRSGSSAPTPGSALRLSQPLSGFPASPSFAALFHAAAVRDSPFRGFPSQESRAPPRAASAPLRSSTDVPNGHRPRLVTAGFLDARALGAVAGLPRRLWAPFSRTREHASWSPWTRTTEPILFRPLHPLRSLDPPANPFALRPGRPERSGRSSPGFAPL